VKLQGPNIFSFQVAFHGGSSRRAFRSNWVAEAQGLPCMLVPRTLSREEWEKKYCHAPAAEEKKTDGQDRVHGALGFEQ
jgi:hypothetical protein